MKSNKNSLFIGLCIALLVGGFYYLLEQFSAKRDIQTQGNNSPGYIEGGYKARDQTHGDKTETNIIINDSPEAKIFIGDDTVTKKEETKTSISRKHMRDGLGISYCSYSSITITKGYLWVKGEKIELKDDQTYELKSLLSEPKERKISYLYVNYNTSTTNNLHMIDSLDRPETKEDDGLWYYKKNYICIGIVFSFADKIEKFYYEDSEAYVPQTPHKLAWNIIPNGLYKTIEFLSFVPKLCASIELKLINTDPGRNVFNKIIFLNKNNVKISPEEMEDQDKDKAKVKTIINLKDCNGIKILGKNDNDNNLTLKITKYILDL